MPFTGSHPAAVLPLLGLGLIPAGLVAGSMAPDVPLFVAVPVSGRRTHSAAGIVTVDVVLGAGLVVAWRALMQPVLVAAAPAGLHARLRAGLPPPVRSLAQPRELARLGLSVAVGAATHVGWDAFTHARRCGTRHIGWLRAGHGRLYGYEWAQYASGAAGLAVLGAWARHWYQVTPPSGPDLAARPDLASEVDHTPVSGAPLPAALPAALPRAVAAAGAAAVVAVSATAGFGAARGALRERNWADAGFLGATRGGAAAVVAVLAGGLVWRASRAATGARQEPAGIRKLTEEEAAWRPGS